MRYLYFIVLRSEGARVRSLSERLGQIDSPLFYSSAMRRARDSRSCSGSNKSVNGHNEMKQFASRAFEEAGAYSWNQPMQVSLE